MEDKCASYCSLDAISEESEMIAHLQSVFWSSSYFDPNLCSSNNTISLRSSSPISVINESNDTSYDHHENTLVAANEMNIGMKRKFQMEEQKGHDKEVCTTLSAPMKNGNKPRAAMDSQSHYAKKRRQRINERLRELQQLIPNGTKVDISTMLEEAVQYVKFLHLQIQLLSSDEMWMYAPLAYDGVNVRLPHLDSLAQE